MKRSALAAGLKAAARKQTTAIVAAPKTTRTVLIGGHFAPEVRRSLLLVQAEQDPSKNLKQLLGEAINDLCAKYGKPEPYSGEP